jgi:hypothetical protein
MWWGVATMKKNGCAFALLSLVLIPLGLWLWKLHPWTPTGSTVCLGKWKFDQHEAEIWQRKTEHWSEPFKTGLFVRKTNGVWNAYWINHDDYYADHVVLVNEGSRIGVRRHSKMIGYFDCHQGTYRRVVDDYDAIPSTITGFPPGQWGLRH